VGKAGEERGDSKAILCAAAPEGIADASGVNTFNIMTPAQRPKTTYELSGYTKVGAVSLMEIGIGEPHDATVSAIMAMQSDSIGEAVQCALGPWPAVPCARPLPHGNPVEGRGSRL
jgi:hypothetical protein